MKLVEQPKSRVSAFIGINNFDKVVTFMRYFDQGLAGTLSSYELIWNNSFKTLTQDPSIDWSPLPYDYNYYVLVEGLGSDQENDQARLESLLEYALNEEMILDAALAYSQSELTKFWHIRENVDALVAVCKYDQHFDISIPIAEIGTTIEAITQKLSIVKGVTHIFPFGHVGDGNIHFIVGKDSDSDTLRKAIDNVVYAPIKDLGGSVSAEHGIGLHKKAYLSLCRSDAEIKLMKMLKKSLDPNNILNRGKVLDIES